MSLYKNLLFLHGHFTDPHMDEGYGPTYGNPRANARALRERWEDAAEVTRGLPGPGPTAAAPACCTGVPGHG